MDTTGALDLRSAFDTHLYDAESGHYISSKHANLASVIRDYDDAMELVWIPPADRSNVDTHPFAIVKREANGYIYTVMKLTEIEMDNPEGVLQRLWMGDTRKNDVLASMEAYEAARQVLKMKRDLEIDEQRRDFATTVLKSGLHTFKHNGRNFG